jgi:alpha-N-arabinofuranosidase
VVFRSKSIWGPFVPAKKNPVLTQRHLDPARPYPITSTGHADFIETKNGEWWAVFLGCRPYEGDLYSTGRETFMLPVSWENEWPMVTDTLIPYAASKPTLQEGDKGDAMTGNFTWRDDFNDTILGMKWNMIRTPHEKWYSLSDDPGSLKMNLRPESIRELGNPSFIGKRQQHGWFTAFASIAPQNFDSTSNAGMIAFQNEKHYIYLGIQKNKDNYSLFIERSGNDQNQGNPVIIKEQQLKSRKPGILYLKITGKGAYYDFYYSADGRKWELVQAEVDARNLSTNIAGGFVGAYIGIYGNTRL